MSKRRHQDLFYATQALLPSVYDFEYAGVLFYEAEGACLYTINCADSMPATVTEDNLIRLPSNMGLTGKAIAARGAVRFPAAQEDSNYRMEIDNVVQVGNLRNALICPIID